MIQKDDFLTPQIDRKMGNILRVNINSTQKSKVLVTIRGFIARGYKFYIVTPNPEIVLMAQKDRELMRILNKADLAIPDGVGLKLVDPSLTIIKGRNLFLSLISLANKKGWRVFLLGGLGREAEISRQKLEISYKKVKLQAFAGPKLDNKAEPVTEVDRVIEKDAIARINKFKPHLLFVAFGAPKQEKWIAGRLDKLDIGGAMVVGGTFSCIAGTGKIPPKSWEDAGFEWVWRLYNEPWRIRRVINAVFVFPLKVFIYKIRSSN